MFPIQSNSFLKFAIIGAGHGGTAMAGHLSLLGFDVSLYNRGVDRIRVIQTAGGIDILSEHKSCPSGFAPILTVTSDISQAIDGRNFIMIVIPASGHREIAEQLAPHLVDDQIVILNPGRTGGALEVLNVIRKQGCMAEVVICETQSLLYACRSVNPAQTKIYSIKNCVPLAAIPAHRTSDVVKNLRLALPQFVTGDNVVKTSLDNVGAIFHPAVTVLNSARIESTRGDFDFYTDGITPSVALILEKLDQERVAVADSLGFRAMTAREWLYSAYHAVGRDLFEAKCDNRGYDGIKAPSTILHRYISEDIPMSLVPIASLGRLTQTPTPTIDSIIFLGSILHQVDFWTIGRTIEKMGLEGMSLKDIHRYVFEGKVG